MKLVRSVTAVDEGPRPSVVTLGNFDGVHRGHQAILARVVERARACNGVAIAVTFYPHPGAVLSSGTGPLLLTTLRQRLARLAACSIDVAVVLHFTPRLAAVEATQFVRRYFIEGLRAQQIVVGARVGFGHRRSGDAALLANMSREHGFALEIVPVIEVDGQPVSSSAIRAAVARGDLDAAARMLNHPYSVEGRVVHGLHRGKTLGFPTANIRPRGLQLPPDGVYAVYAFTRRMAWRGVANLGVNPTFGDRERTLEAHLFDCNADLYGERMEVRFVQQLRRERKFPSVDALIQQIQQDVAMAQRILR